MGSPSAHRKGASERCLAGQLMHAGVALVLAWIWGQHPWGGQLSVVLLTGKTPAARSSPHLKDASEAPGQQPVQALWECPGTMAKVPQ